ncbi:MAG: nucleotidyltransferase family protein [Spirochaetales bacterium]|nr:nucleotidyltransferase family protein [Candidatus Physcosoma equi]
MTTIILAAGLSSRMGRNKLVLPYKESTVLECTLETVKKTGSDILIVVGHDKERIEEIARRHHIRTVYNPNYEKGQKSSSMRGIEEVEDDFALLPGDLPLVQAEDILRAFSALEDAPTARSFHSGLPGHPVCYRKEIRDRLLSYPGTMKEFLMEVGTARVPSSIGSVFDIDTPEKYQALLGSDDNPAILEKYLN